MIALLLGAALAQGAYQRIDSGVIVTPAEGSERQVRLQVYGDGLFRVTAVPTDEIALPQSLMVIAQPTEAGFSIAEAPGRVTLTTARASAEVDLDNGNVRFRNPAGETMLEESGPAAFAPVSV